MKPDGRTAHFMRIDNMGKNKSKTKAVGIPLDKIVDYDLNNFKLTLRDDFELMKRIVVNDEVYLH
jgi:2-C-methyl-D-erythritol 4-phosphate cytidylyltransferase